MNSIRHYLIPNKSGVFTMELPQHCRILELLGDSLVVFGNHDPERLVRKRFVAVLGGANGGDAWRHRYLGTVLRSAPDAQYQYVFEWTDLPPSQHLGGGHT